MFYFEKIERQNCNEIRFIEKRRAFFTMRESIIKTKKKILKNLFMKTKKINRNSYPDCDGLILTNKEQGIFFNFANSTPLIFYDEKQNTGAVSHIGWCGTVGKNASLQSGN